MNHRVLVPFELPDAEPLSPELIDDLACMEVVVLGHFGLPEQTPPDVGRAQFSDEAQVELRSLAKPFEERDSLVTTRLVFGRHRAKTVDRIALEEDCDAELDPAPTSGIERILVPLLDTKNFDRHEDFLRTLCEDRTQEITLFHVAETSEEGEDEDPEAVKGMLQEAREKMVADGFDPDLIDVSVVVSDSHDAEILSKAEEYDAVVMGEAHPEGVREWVFGTLADRIADQTGDPVFIVRRNI